MPQPSEREALQIQILESPPRRSPKVPETPAESPAPAKRIRRQRKPVPEDSGDAGTDSQETLIAKPEKSVPKDIPKSGAPTPAEWQDFFGRVVLRALFEGYVILMLKDYELTPREQESIKLTKEDLAEMSAPLASAASKNKFAAKHGREIIALADSYEAFLAMFIWIRRVNKISRRHRKLEVANQPQPPAPTLQERVQANGQSARSDDGERHSPRPAFIPHPSAVHNPGGG